MSELLEEGPDVAGRQPEFAVFARSIDLHQNVDASALTLEPTLQLECHREPINGLHFARECENILYLVCLEVTNHRPTNVVTLIKATDRSRLGYAFLHPIFPQPQGLRSSASL